MTLNPIVRYGSYGKFAGPYIRGTQKYVPPAKASEWDVIEYAIASPEGGAYDGVFMADGTGVTFGLFQWTLTSGRLQRLLHFIADALLLPAPALDNRLGAAWTIVPGKSYVIEDIGTGRPMDTAALREHFTPTSGVVPRTGFERDFANSVAKTFWRLGQVKGVPAAQDKFAREELRLECEPKRPMLDVLRIRDVLYPSTMVPWSLSCDLSPSTATAARALFWSCWQNAPRQAERVLLSVYKRVHLDIDAPTFALKLAQRIANSTFGNWGIAKARANGRVSRYAKIVRAVNELMGPGTLPLSF
jgi:hypothetical protein